MPQLPRLGLRIASLALIASIALWLLLSAISPSGAAHSNAAGGWHPVRAPEAAAELLMQGVVEGAARAEVVAPFDATVVAVRVNVGDAVVKGTQLLELGRASIDGQIRELRAQLIKSEQSLADARGWKESATYRAALRQTEADQANLLNTSRRLADTEQLLSKGIVSMDELQQARQAEASARSQLESSRDALAQFKARATSSAIRLAELERDNLSAKLIQLQRKAAETSIVAPIDGVVTLLGSRDQDPSGQPIAVGARVTEGGLIARVVDAKKLQVHGTVSESAVDQVKVGQHAKVRPANQPGTTLEGRVARVSELPSGESIEMGGQDRRAARFKVAIDVMAPPGNPPLPKLGTTAEVSIVAGDAPDGLIVDLGAVERVAGGVAVVRVRRGGQTLAPMKVQVGATTRDGIYVLKGALRPDDQVWVNADTATSSKSEPESVDSPDQDEGDGGGLRGRLRRLFGGETDARR